MNHLKQRLSMYSNVKLRLEMTTRPISESLSYTWRFEKVVNLFTNTGNQTL